MMDCSYKVSFPLFILLFWTLSAQAKDLCGLKYPLNFSQIKHCLEKHPQKIKTIEDLLGQLPRKFRKKYALMYNSRSLQKASFQNPRVIMYGEGEIDLVLTFTGEKEVHPGESFSPEGFYSLELISWNKQEKAFEFREILFPSPLNKLKQANISEKNPTKCFTCHGNTDLRPNWQHYNQWPGAYSSNDDRVTDEERPHLEKFFTYAKTHPRYKYLLNLEKDFEVLDDPFQLQKAKEDPTYRPITYGLHNSILLEGLADRNFQRVARIMAKHPKYSVIKYALLEMLMCDKVNYLELKSEDSDLLGYLQDPANTCGWPYQQYDPAFLQFYYVLTQVYEVFGIPTLNWFMDFRPEPFYSFNIPGTFFSKLSAKLIEQDKDLSPFFRLVDRKFDPYPYGNIIADYYPGKGRDKTCQELQVHTQEAKKYIQQTLSNLQAQCRQKSGPHFSAELTLKSCVQCHKNSYPFDQRILGPKDIETIKLYISAASPWRMPTDKRLHLSEDEQKIFVDYLQKNFVQKSRPIPPSL